MAAGQRRSQSSGQLSWPFVGREDELEFILGAFDGSRSGVVVSGAAGVGKTRLAREVLAAARDYGSETEWVQATSAAASIPLGAFAGLMPAGVHTDDRLQLFQLCANELRDRARPDRIFLGVDDAHLLDPVSAALVLHLATTETAFVIATVRAGERCPDSIIALWKDLEAPRLELQQLSADETARLLEGALGGEVAGSVLRWAFGASEGHVLYLRELVKGALESGALVKEGGRWRLSARPEATPGLVELVSGALESLGDDELGAARLLALAEPLELDVVSSISGTAPLSRLEEKGLAVVAAPGLAGTPSMVRLAHPLYGEVVRSTLPTLRGIELRLRLAEVALARGLDRPGQALRVAIWLDDAGAELDEPLLLAAARDALTAGDADLAERLALRVQRGPEAALALASAHVRRGRFGDAEATLASWEGKLPTTDLALAYLEERAIRVLHLGLLRSDQALDLLARSEDWFGDPSWRERVNLLRSQVLLTSPGTGPAEAIDTLDILLREDDLLPEMHKRASVLRALALYEVGRTDEARALSASLRPSVPLDDADDAYALMAWWAARHVAGYEWDETERWLLESERAGACESDLLTRGEITTLLACSANHRGKPATATRWAREAIDVLERSDTARRLPIAWLSLVISTARLRDVEPARRALAGYWKAVGNKPLPYLMGLEATALAALAVAEGEQSRAVQTLLDAAASCKDDPVDRGHLLHEALRAGATPRTVGNELEAAATACDAPLVAIFARVARAVAADDGKALVAEAEALAEIGAWLWAAETAARAAVAYHQTGREDAARRSLGLSSRFLSECEDVWSPVLAAVEVAPAELTRRELEVTTLAARGASNAEIAERLVLSVRTVESHLYRAMRKLGVNTREQLPTP
jgi:DNA-binding CsgD family transcriptional regulator